ncbi:MAG: PAS domain S-box protein [Acidimicrobiales bacterium]
MRVSELARRTGVTPSTLRAWERRFGILNPERTAGGQRLYAEADVDRVLVIRRLVTEGLTLAAAAAHVDSAGAGPLPAEGEALFLRRILQAVDTGVWVSRNSATRFVNRRMIELMGCSRDELMSRSVLDFIDPEYMDVVAENGHLGRAGARRCYELMLVRPDGTKFRAEVRTTPLHDRAGRYEGAVALVVDVTDRGAVDASARYRSALLDSLPHAVVGTDLDGAIVYLNPAGERLLGWRLGEVAGKAAVDVFAAPDVRDEAAELRDRVRAGSPLATQLRVIRRDRRTFLAHFSSGPIVSDEGEVIGMIAVFSDQTEHLRLEREVQTHDIQAETVALLGAHALSRTAREAEVTPVLVEIVEATRRVLEAQRSAIVQIEPDGRLTVRVTSPEADPRAVVGAGSHSLSGYTAIAGRVIVVEDTNRERRFDTGPLRGRDARSAIAAPVFAIGGAVNAVLMAEDSAPRRFGRSAVHFMQAMANVVGAAVR